MIRRRAWTMAALTIAAAVVVWRGRVSRRRSPAMATRVRVPDARPVGQPSLAVASAPVTDDATDVTDLAAADDVTTSGEPVSAARVFSATDPTVDDTVTDDTDTETETETETDEPAGAPTGSQLDLEQIASDLEGVAAALARLDDGTYWTDEVTGEPLVEELLVADPVARRNR